MNLLCTNRQIAFGSLVFLIYACSLTCEALGEEKPAKNSYMSMKMIQIWQRDGFTCPPLPEDPPLDGDATSVIYKGRKAIVKYKWIILNYKEINNGACLKWKTDLYMDKSRPVEVFDCRTMRKIVINGSRRISVFNKFADFTCFGPYEVDSSREMRDVKYVLLQQVVDICYTNRLNVGSIHTQRVYQPVFTSLWLYRERIHGDILKKK